MITGEQAREIVVAYLARLETEEPSDNAVLVKTQEHRFGWEFRYQSSKYVQSGDVRHMWVGTGPIVVDRRDGRLEELGGRQFGDTVAQYQAQYDRDTSSCARKR
ncbi:YrhB domain-containing protein [Streptomyces sp. Marseille-Q5077]|uniref:YrhB domain-containing protein n=1 Tax=Streptomyces sp. Marseille-Q5077 TaxID=3418995 RepID=UPI003CFCADE3